VVLRLLVLFGGIALWLSFAATAFASLFLILDVAAAPPGTVVHGHTPFADVTDATQSTLRVFFAPARWSESIASPEDPRLVPLGGLVVDAAGTGKLAFTVPRVPPGAYAVLVECQPCAPHSAGRVILPLADFRVTTALPATDTAPPSNGGTSARFAGALVVIAGLAAGIAVASARRGSCPSA
jgi:hypothetical protein